MADNDDGGAIDGREGEVLSREHTIWEVEAIEISTRCSIKDRYRYNPVNIETYVACEMPWVRPEL